MNSQYILEMCLTIHRQKNLFCLIKRGRKKKKKERKKKERNLGWIHRNPLPQPTPPLPPIIWSEPTEASGFVSVLHFFKDREPTHQMRQIELLVEQQKKKKLTWKGWLIVRRYFFILTNVWKVVRFFDKSYFLVYEVCLCKKILPHVQNKIQNHNFFERFYFLLRLCWCSLVSNNNDRLV